MAISSRALIAVKWTAIALGAIVLALLITAAVLQRNADALRGPIARLASAHAGRAVHIDGRLELHLLSFAPYAVVNGVRVGNPDWLPSVDMAQIGRLEISLSLPSLFKGEVVLPRVDIQKLDLSLVRDATDRANWDFGEPHNRPAESPAKLPVVRSFSLDRARIDVVDAIRKLRFSGTITATQAGGSNTRSLHLDGSGELNGAPFRLTTTGDPLITAERGRPYNFSADISAGRTHLGFTSRIAKPFDLGSLVAKFSVSGADLADVYYLTGLTLPNTPAYKISGDLQRDGTRIKLGNLAGSLGNSDLNGTMVIETAGKRPVMTAELTSRSLDISDLGPALGAPAKASAAAPVDAKPARIPRRAALIEPLLPDEPLDVERVRGMDADVHYRALSVNAQKIPFKRVAFRLRLDHGVMTIDPLSFVLPQGAVAARLRIDASRDLPDVDLEGRLSAVDLTQFHAAGGEPPLEGLMRARVSVHGQGRSVHAVAATANGTLTAVVPHGEVRSAFAELTGINMARGLGLILTKDQTKAEVRCAIADFRSADGIMTAQNIVIDTRNVRITAKGSVNMRTETLDLFVNGQPKKVRFATLKSPIIVHGPLRRPSVALEPGHIAKQTAMAVALSAIATPLAAVLAFIDPGLAKDQDCGALLAEAKEQGVSDGAHAAPPSGKSTGSVK
jgi:AsmA family protein